MENVIEDNRNEFKLILNKNFEKEVSAFLNSKEGGNIFLGISDNREIVGITGDLDKKQLELKDKILNNICPAPIGLFEVIVKQSRGKHYIHLAIASGNEKPYYLKNVGMTTEGCFFRVGSSTEKMPTQMIVSLFSKRTRNSLRNVISPTQELEFSQLKIFYEERGYTIKDNFLKQLNFFTADSKYNYVAYLLSDNNSISIQVAKYSGIDAEKLIENEEYRNSSLIKITKNVLNKIYSENITSTKITKSGRLDSKLFDDIAMREAVVNAIVHNDWLSERSPKFEIFRDRISISSSGGLPEGFTEEEFLDGFSAPRNPELMRVFKDLGLGEQLGTGIIRILTIYDKDIFKFYPNFIRINFDFNNEISKVSIDDTVNDSISLTDIQLKILELMKGNESITQDVLAIKLDVSKSTIARSIKVLIESGLIERQGSTKSAKWIVL